jgi:hypothetical protein
VVLMVNNFDATVRYELAGMAFLTLVEAKLHKNPIKRETVQVAPKTPVCGST